MSVPQIPGFTLKDRIGRGAFGAVWRAQWNDEFPCAVKILSPDRFHAEYLGWCLERLREKGPPGGLIRTYAFDLINDPPHLSTELLPEAAVAFGDLAGRLPRHEAWPLLESVARTLASMHRQRVVHTGLTDRNAFVYAADTGEPQVVLTDAGQGWIGNAPSESLHTQAPFISPDRWRQPSQILEGVSSESWDVYAFGVLAWRVLNGTWPRGAQLFDAIRNALDEELNLDPVAFADWLDKEPAGAWSAASKDKADRERRRIVEKCISLTPSARYPSMVEVEAALKDAPPVPHDADTAGVPSPMTESVPVALPPVKSITVTAPQEKPVPVTPEPGPVSILDTPQPFPAATARQPEAAADDEPCSSPAPAGKRSPLWPVLAGFSAAAAIALGLLAARLNQSLAAAGDEKKTAEAAAAAKAGELQQAKETLNAARNAAETDVRLEGLRAERDSLALAVEAVLAEQPEAEDGLDSWRAQHRGLAVVFEEAMKRSAAEAALEPTSLQARWALTHLMLAMGRDGDAAPLLDVLVRDLQARAATGLSPEEGLLHARVLARRGGLLLQTGRTADALDDLKHSGDMFDSWCSQNRDDRTAARDYAQQSLLEGRALAERDRAEEARPVLARVSALLGAPKSEGFREQDVFLIADAMHETSRVELKAGGQTETAITLQIDLTKLLLDYERGHQRSVSCRYRLARAYLETGKLILLNGAPYDASVAYAEAVKFLTDLKKEYPERTLFQYDLARAYHDVAQLAMKTNMRGNGAKEALGYIEGSTGLLHSLCEQDAGNTAWRRAHAEALVTQSGFQETLGQLDAALTSQKDAVDILGELSGDPAFTDADRRALRLLQAKTLLAQGALQQKRSRNEDAVAALRMADETLQPLVEAQPPDTAAQEIAQAVKQLRSKVQP